MLEIKQFREISGVGIVKCDSYTIFEAHLSRRDIPENPPFSNVVIAKTRQE